MKRAATSIVGLFTLLSIAAAQPSSSNTGLLLDPKFETLGKPGAVWKLDVHKDAAATAERTEVDGTPAVVVTVPAVAPKEWHVQFQQNKVSLEKDVRYKLEVTGKADQEFPVLLFVQQQDKPYAMLGPAVKENLVSETKTLTHEFTSKATDSNVKIAVVLGAGAGKVTISSITLTRVN